MSIGSSFGIAIGISIWISIGIPIGSSVGISIVISIGIPIGISVGISIWIQFSPVSSRYLNYLLRGSQWELYTLKRTDYVVTLTQLPRGGVLQRPPPESQGRQGRRVGARSAHGWVCHIQKGGVRFFWWGLLLWDVLYVWGHFCQTECLVVPW